MPERKNVNATIVAEAAEERVVLFGWCMDGNDKGCIEKFSGHRCSCDCHHTERSLEKVAEVVVYESNDEVDS
jgi:hypothetical protein